MIYFVKNRLQIQIIGLLVILMLCGCASVKEMKVGEKYEGSKSWIKEKWHAMGAKFSSSDDEEGSIKSDDQTTEDFVAERRVKYFEHKVQWSGESLSLIAKWYTGHYSNWKALAQANPGLKPDRIDIGDIICIPPGIMITKKPLPYKIVAKTRSGYFAHTVRKPDEKLADIADWYTGDKGNAKKIAQVNPDIDPELLLVGNEIFIPSDLLKTRQPFYESSIQASASKVAEQPAASPVTTPAPTKKKIELFGPKQF
jgi:hypothetical protein